MDSLNQIVQIVFDIVDQGHHLPSLLKSRVIDTGVLAMKDVMIGDRYPANVP
jgi:hypothetical protein